jgi:hypothetical protein
VTSRGDNYYAVLGVTPEFPVEAVEGLRRSLSKLYHPDAGSQPNPQRMAAVNEACDVLGNPDLRVRYDARQATAPHRQPPAASAPSQHRRPPESTSPSEPSAGESRILWEGRLSLVIGPASGRASIVLARQMPKPPTRLIGGGFGRGRNVGSVLRWQQQTSVYVSLTPTALQFRAAVFLGLESRTARYAPDGGVLAELALGSITRATHHRVGFAGKAIMVWTNEGDWCFTGGWTDLGPAVRGQLIALGRVIVAEGIDSWAVSAA